MNSHHPDPATAAWVDYTAAGEAYRAANARLIQTCLVGIAVTARETSPTATHVVLGVSDQGPYLAFTAIIDPECDLDDNEIEETDNEDSMWSYSGDLPDEDPFGDWTPFVIEDGDPEPYHTFHRRAPIDPTGRVHSYVLDIDLILFYEGDATRVNAEVSA